MSRTNVTAETSITEENEAIAEVKEVVTEVKKTVEKPVSPLSSTPQKMNARQFFDTYPHDNKAVVALIIALYGTKTKTVDEWEAFYQQMLKKKVN